MDLSIHPAAGLFPPLSEPELDRLAEEIGRHGLRRPIVLYQGAVLDGRGRLEACRRAGVEPRLMGIGPVPATRLVLERAGLTLDQMDVIELNEAFAAQGLAVLRELKVADDDARVNPNGGAIALGHPLGMSGARLALTAARELQKTKKRYALCTMCIGVGQGYALILERA